MQDFATNSSKSFCTHIYGANNPMANAGPKRGSCSCGTGGPGMLCGNFGVNKITSGNEAWPFNWIYALVNIHKAIEAMAIEIVDLPIKNSGSFHSYVKVYQRVMGFKDFKGI